MLPSLHPQSKIGENLCFAFFPIAGTSNKSVLASFFPTSITTEEFLLRRVSLYLGERAYSAVPSPAISSLEWSQLLWEMHTHQDWRAVRQHLTDLQPVTLSWSRNTLARLAGSFWGSDFAAHVPSIFQPGQAYLRWQILCCHPHFPVLPEANFNLKSLLFWLPRIPPTWIKHWKQLHQIPFHHLNKLVRLPLSVAQLEKVLLHAKNGLLEHPHKTWSEYFRQVPVWQAHYPDLPYPNHTLKAAILACLFDLDKPHPRLFQFAKVWACPKLTRALDSFTPAPGEDELWHYRRLAGFAELIPKALRQPARTLKEELKREQTLPKRIQEAKAQAWRVVLGQLLRELLGELLKICPTKILPARVRAGWLLKNPYTPVEGLALLLTSHNKLQIPANLEWEVPEHLNLQAWLTGIDQVCGDSWARSASLEEGLEMGCHFGTCLSLKNGFMNHSLVPNLLDINKQIVYLRSARGKVQARVLLAIDQKGQMVIYPTYRHLDPPFQWYELLEDFAQRCGMAVSDGQTEVSVLQAHSHCYQDPPFNEDTLHWQNDPGARPCTLAELGKLSEKQKFESYDLEETHFLADSSELLKVVRKFRLTQVKALVALADLSFAELVQFIDRYSDNEQDSYELWLLHWVWLQKPDPGTLWRALHRPNYSQRLIHHLCHWIGYPRGCHKRMPLFQDHYLQRLKHAEQLGDTPQDDLWAMSRLSVEALKRARMGCLVSLRQWIYRCEPDAQAWRCELMARALLRGQIPFHCRHTLIECLRELDPAGWPLRHLSHAIPTDLTTRQLLLGLQFPKLRASTLAYIQTRPPQQRLAILAEAPRWVNESDLKMLLLWRPDPQQLPSQFLNQIYVWPVLRKWAATLGS